MFKAILFLIFTSFCFTSHAQVLAKIGNESITLKEFNKLYDEATKNSFSTVPTRKQYLEDLVRFKVGLKEAEKKKIKKHPLVKKALEQELYKGLLEVSLAKQVEKIKVTEGEMKQFYTAHPDLRTSHILIRYPINATEKQIAEAQSRANKIYKDVASKKRPWDTYTRIYSEDEINKNLGGDIGYHSSATVHPKYYNAAKTLKVGQISKPVRSVFGFHIIKLTGKRSYNSTDKARLKIRVFNEKRVAILNDYFKKIKKKYPISVNESLLN